MSKLTAGLALIAVLALAGCRAAPMYSPSDVVFQVPATSSQAALTLDDYENAIRRAGSKRHWTFKKAGPGHLIGDVAVRNKHFATVDVFFDTQNFSISHKASTNLNYNAGRNEIHPNYNTWVRNLQNDIQAEIVQMRAS